MHKCHKKMALDTPNDGSIFGVIFGTYSKNHPHIDNLPRSESACLGV